MSAPGPAADLRRWAAEERAGTVGLLQQLTDLDAPSGAPELLRAPAGLLRSCLSAMGAEVELIESDAGPHIRARFGAPGRNGVAVLCHYDTVWPAGTAAARPFRIEDGVAYGPGVFDMRGGLVASLRAIEALLALGALERPVTMLVTADEESGSRTSQPLVEQLRGEASLVLIPEPPLAGGVLKTSRKGLFTYELSVTGLAAHAGLDPDGGASAIHALLTVLDAVRDLERRELGTTVNVGTIGGGIAGNVIAASASATVDIRVVDRAEADRIAGAVTGLATADPRTTLTVELLHSRDPMERTDAIAEAFEAAARIAAEAGIELREGHAGGGSDGCFLAPLGVAVLDGLGPDGGGAHAVDERVLLDSLDERIVLHGLLLARPVGPSN